MNKLKECLEGKQPTDLRYYQPLERPRRYPLELTENLHICLWSKNGKLKWTIAYWQRLNDGYNLHFVGNRPLDLRVNWEHFRELIALGQVIADKYFQENHEV